MRNLIGFIGGVTLLLASLVLAYPAKAGEKCVYSDKTYSDGAEVCMEGWIYVCDDGSWEFRGPRC